jgi:hypothetical protein
VIVHFQSPRDISSLFICIISKYRATSTIGRIIEFDAAKESSLPHRWGLAEFAGRLLTH